MKRGSRKSPFKGWQNDLDWKVKLSTIFNLNIKMTFFSPKPHFYTNVYKINHFFVIRDKFG